MRAGEVRAVSVRRLHELTHLCQTISREPSFTVAALNRHTIRPQFIWTHGLVGTFVTENPQFYRGCETGEEGGIKNDESFIRTAEVT